MNSIFLPILSQFGNQMRKFTFHVKSFSSLNTPPLFSLSEDEEEFKPYHIEAEYRPVNLTGSRASRYLRRSENNVFIHLMCIYFIFV